MDLRDIMPNKISQNKITKQLNEQNKPNINTLDFKIKLLFLKGKQGRKTEREKCVYHRGRLGGRQTKDIVRGSVQW